MLINIQVYCSFLTGTECEYDPVLNYPFYLVTLMASLSTGVCIFLSMCTTRVCTTCRTTARPTHGRDGALTGIGKSCRAPWCCGGACSRASATRDRSSLTPASS